MSSADGKGGSGGGGGDRGESSRSKYALSASLLSDGEPVRSICSLPPPDPNDPLSHELVSGSQGGVLTSTFLPARETSIQPGGDGTRHSHQITALLALPSGAGGGYVTGCKDKLLRVFDDKHRLLRKLEGHDNAVTSLAWMDLLGNDDDGKGCLVSGSWDGTAKIWNVASGYCMATLSGHENTVSVCSLPAKSSSIGRVVTGSAGIARGNVISDHSIRIWEVELVGDGSLANGVLKKTVKNDHSGPIRGLAYDPASGCVVSCSNDGTVKVRDGSTGECVATLAFPGSSQPMLLDVAALEGGGGGGVYVAAAEDGNACVWGKSDEPQVIPHPGCVWKVLSLPNGDFATACHDGYVRIFTTDPNRFASDEEVKQLQAAVTESNAAKSTGPTQEEIAKLPKWESNASHRGRSEGQVQVFNKNGKAIAAQWSATSQTWIEVGEVTGRNENAGSIDGVSYDHVFPIEIDVPGGGVRKLRIGYNNGENPFVVAQKFIDDYELDQGYLAQIADYIRSRVGEENVTLGMGEGGPTAANSGAEVHSGPTPMDIQTPPKPTYRHLPMRGYKSFETGADAKSFAKILSKLKEFNTTIDSDKQLPETDVTKVLRGLADTLSTTNRYHATKIADDELNVLKRMLTEWDCDKCFPALDLGRSTVLHPDGGRADREGYWTEVIQLALTKCQQVTERNVQGTASVAVPMLSLRLFANCFKGGSGSAKAVASQLKSVLGCAESFARSSNKNVRLSVATVALNASSYMKTHPDDPGSSSPEQILSVVGTILGSGLYETEGTVRALVALGTALLLDDDETKAKARASNVASTVRRAAEPHGDKAKAIAGEIRSILE